MGLKSVYAWSEPTLQMHCWSFHAETPLRWLCQLQEGEQADTSQQGQKAPKNPITGEPLTPVTNKDKEGYQATTLAGQSEETHARIFDQLDGQGGRPFGGRSKASCDTLRQAWCALCCITQMHSAWERTVVSGLTYADFSLHGLCFRANCLHTSCAQLLLSP
jgi:hypothetical protein